MKIQKKLLQCLLILFSIVSIACANDVFLKNDTRYTVSVSPWFRPSVVPHTPFIDIQPGQTKKIAIVDITGERYKYDDLLGIIVTYQGEWQQKMKMRQGSEELRNNNFVSMWVNKDTLDKLQHRATWDKDFPINYALKVGWSMAYFIEPIPPFQEYIK